MTDPTKANKKQNQEKKGKGKQVARRRKCNYLKIKILENSQLPILPQPGRDGRPSRSVLFVNKTPENRVYKTAIL